MRDPATAISKGVKTLGVFNLLTILFWIRMAGQLSFTSRPGEMFASLEAEFSAVLFLGILYSLQGLLVFFKQLGKWDLVASSTIFLISMYFWISLAEPYLLIAAAPIVVYFLLQIRRDKMSDNFKVAYLNIWGLVLTAIAVVLAK